MKYICIFLIVSVNIFQSLYASTLLQLDTLSLVNKSELIFEGEVISTHSEQDSSGYIHTYVDFLLTDVLFGNIGTAATVTLRFTGGTVGDLTLDIASTIPTMGERGIYFIEARDKNLANPLLGWSQGHFIIQENNTLIAGNKQLVVDVVKESSDRNTTELSKGIAKGIITVTSSKSKLKDAANPNIKPLTTAQFKKMIKGLIDVNQGVK